MEKRRHGLWKMLFAFFSLSLLSLNVTACEKVLSFNDFKTKGFSTIDGAGAGLVYAPTDKTANKKKCAMLSMEEDGTIHETELENDNGKQEQINLNLYRYGLYGKYAVMAYVKKDYGRVFRYDFPEQYYEGRWYTFIYSLITGKLYYLNVDGVNRIELVKSYGNVITARGTDDRSYKLLMMTETNDGLVVENMETLFEFLYSDQSLNPDIDAFYSSTSKDGNMLFGAYLIRKYDGSFEKKKHVCGELVDGRLALLKKTNGKNEFFVLDRDLNEIPYEEKNKPVFRMSSYFNEDGADYDLASVIYEDSNLVMYLKNRSPELHCVTFGNDTISDNVICETALLSRQYLFGNSFIYLDLADYKVHSFDLKSHEDVVLYDLASLDPINKEFSLWQYGPGGYFYVRYAETIKGKQPEEDKIKVTAGLFVNGEFVECDNNEAYFDYVIAPTYQDDIDEIVNSKTIDAENRLMKKIESVR